MRTIAARIGQLLAWRPRGCLRQSGVLLARLAVRALAQTVLFVLVARVPVAMIVVVALSLFSVFSFRGMDEVSARPQASLARQACRCLA